MHGVHFILEAVPWLGREGLKRRLTRQTLNFQQRNGVVVSEVAARPCWGMESGEEEAITNREELG
jgi:hypothetical protein